MIFSHNVTTDLSYGTQYSTNYFTSKAPHPGSQTCYGTNRSGSSQSTVAFGSSASSVIDPVSIVVLRFGDETTLQYDRATNNKATVITFTLYTGESGTVPVSTYI